MAIFQSSMTTMCPSGDQHCSKWARIYMSYCLCSVKDGVSLTLGSISVLSWGVAEIPQIITNYKEKSTEGLSLAFLITWIIGDLFNIFGCMLEPSTLPTQYYMAVLYTLTSVILAAQTIYYIHIYPGLKNNRRRHKGPIPSQTEAAGKIRQGNNDAGAQVSDSDKWRNGSATRDGKDGLSSPIPFPAVPQKGSPGGGLYYVSARSLSSSRTPTAGSFLAQRMTPLSVPIRNSIEEPFLGRDVTTQSAPDLNTKTMLCLVSVVSFFGMLNFHQSANSRLDVVFEDKNQGFVMLVGRKILQASIGVSQENDIDGSSGIGTFLGWAMAAIYMGGRLPQICLNIRRGNVEGLNPLMFIFALVGNITYVASILVSSLAWSKVKPNLPWLVDAGGCVLLDACIVLQFVYFRYRRHQVVDDNLQNSNTA